MNQVVTLAPLVGAAVSSSRDAVTSVGVTALAQSGTASAVSAFYTLIAAPGAQSVTATRPGDVTVVTTTGVIAGGAQRRDLRLSPLLPRVHLSVVSW